MSPTRRVPGTSEVKSRVPSSSSIWLLICAVLACGSWTVVFFHAAVRTARSPFWRMIAPTVGADTGVPAVVSIRVSWSRPARPFSFT